MTTADFDPRNLDLYQEPRYLLHFQFGGSSNVYRYALVEQIETHKINARNKQKKDELDLTQEQIWKTYG